MAAQACVQEGARVAVFDAMPSVGRKFLLAGKGGLNLTHSEPLAAFESRYGSRREQLQPMLEDLGPAQLRTWAQALGVDTFVGSSGRVFPREMKAAPMLRAWLRRLRDAGVVFHSRCRWTGSIDSQDAGVESRLRIAFSRRPAAGSTTEQDAAVLEAEADAVILALGGGSWPRLGSDGAWAPWLAQRGVGIAPLAPSNCGFDCGWSERFSSRWAGTPVKSIAMGLAGRASGHGADNDDEADAAMLRGEFVVTATGVEGSIVYRLAAPARDRIAADGSATLHVDLLPDRPEAGSGNASRGRAARCRSRTTCAAASVSKG
jgi:uncharacterized flavoprotein (TIGR03862 family)